MSPIRTHWTEFEWPNGVPCPKPKTQKQIKAKKRRELSKVVKSVRAEVIARAQSCCERCGQFCGEAGHAHHRIPRSRGGEWTLGNIEYLCAGCHYEAHMRNAL